ncbi:secreted ookinete protein, putative [Plasmodium chabaudi chabaudi]|uniref:Secreted ookinete protein, putative n=1 Tax=Plasmodium chabaudi chabaudi TaxID=31271 RepID=A0A4V0KBN2_PLACU|nr:secreted ookinete protein, putative [Plasmodium chabaudi chabaudi]VTZ70532.1 secreted ookinete protein, putative [Plasmodium chabaudi chabaudi]|eukprot:XP_739169.2 secreted ookinete protein, putative [Plasmodium chabaudi chabaudi]
MMLTLFPTMNIKNKLFIICICFFILRNAYAERLNDAENKFSIKIKNGNKINNTGTKKSFYVNKKTNNNSNSKENSTNALKLNEETINKFNKRKNGDNDTTERKQLIRNNNLSRQKRGRTNTSFIIKSTDDAQINSKQETNSNQSNFRNKVQPNDDVKNALKLDDTESNGSKKLYDNNDDIDNSENSEYSSESTSDDLLDMDDLYSYADEDLINDDITEDESIDDLFEDSMTLYDNLDKMDDKNIDSSLNKGAKKVDIDVVNAHENGAYLKESKQNSVTKNVDDKTMSSKNVDDKTISSKNVDDKTISSKNADAEKKTTSDEKRDNRIISKPNKTIKKDTPESKVNPLNKLNGGNTHDSKDKKGDVSKSSGNKTIEKSNTNHKNKIGELHNKGTDKIAKQSNASNIANKENSNKASTTESDKNGVSDIDDSNKTDKIGNDETKSIGEIININIAFNPETANENKKLLEKTEKKKHTGIRSMSRNGKMPRKNNKSAKPGTKPGTKSGTKSGTKHNKASVNSFDSKDKTDKHAQKNGKDDKKGKHTASFSPDETENDGSKNKNDISISIEVPKEMGNIQIPSSIVKHTKKGNTMDIESFININAQNDNGNDNIEESNEVEDDDTDDEENENDETKGSTNGPFISNTMEVESLNTENKLAIEKEKEDKNLEQYSHENNAEDVENGEHPLITKKKNIIKNSRKVYNLKLYNCSYIDDWDLNNEYIDEEGKLVKLSGYVFQNNVNSDSMPTTNITDWKLKGSCDHDKYICGALKYMNNIYNKGERVIFDGKIYEATSDAYGNPKELANVWIDKTSDCYNF